MDTQSLSTPSATPPSGVAPLGTRAPHTPVALPSPHSYRGERILELDGFRAIAVLAVVIHHAFYGYPNPTDALVALPKLFTFVVSRGWLGVDLFFVLSGFLISGILLDCRDSPRYFKNFYCRRALRILPVYLAVLAVCWLAYPTFGTYFVLSLGMLANLAYSFNVPIPHGPGVFWSLAVEEHFYLLWPLLVFTLTRMGLLSVASVIVLGTPVLRAICASSGMDVESQIYVYSWFRFDGLALGAIVAIWMRSKYNQPRRTLIFGSALALLCVTITMAGAPFGLMGTKTVAAAALRYTQVQLLVAAAITASLALRGTWYTALLRCRFARITSDYSYCIYLVHLSLGDAYVTLMSRIPWQVQDVAGGFGAVLVRAAVIGIASYGIAGLSFRFFEQPILRLKRLFEH